MDRLDADIDACGRIVGVRRILEGGYELDDDPDRIDRAGVHRYLCEESYWAAGRTREIMDELIDNAERVVGLYHDGAQVGFTRAVSDGHTVAYLADVYVLEEHRGRALGVELVSFSVDEGALAEVRKWLLHTKDAHGVYARIGFAKPDDRFMERWSDV